MEKTGLTFIWTGEKRPSLYQELKKKNPVNPHQVIHSVQERTWGKVKAFGIIIDGRCLPVHWFEEPGNGASYLEMLKTVMWPAVRAVATRRGCWFQQDGTPSHGTSAAGNFVRQS